MIIILLLVFSTVSCDDYVKDYLSRYGYIEEGAISDDVSDGLIKFQEFFGLPVDGKPNEETLKLMHTPRCGIPDKPNDFTIYPNKWNKTHLIWYFSLANSEQKEVAERAFNEWQKISKLTFEYNIKDPDIFITYSKRPIEHGHSDRCMMGKCHFKFDGAGGVLAHAFFPNANSGCREIHLDKSENWYLKYDTPPDGEYSLYSVLMHEIGHSLGIMHSGVSSALMYPFYSPELNISDDDIFAIQYLYGIPDSSTKLPINKKPIEKPVEIPVEIPAEIPVEKPIEEPDDKASALTTDLCSIKYPDNMMITSNHHLYIFHKKSVWVKNINDKRFREPRLITDYLPSLRQITHVYQRPKGDIMVIDENKYYVIEFPSFRINRTGNVRELGVPNNQKIRAIFNTYTGRTFLFYGHYYFIELDECNLKQKDHGFITEIFPGLPTDVNGAFRYRNGMLYFFRKKNNKMDLYEYDEFLNTIVKVEPFDFSIFDINCPNVSVLEQLKALLTKLSTFYFETD